MNLPISELGIGPFFGSKTLFASELWPENMDLSPSTLGGLAWSQIWQVTALAAVVGIVTRVGCRHRPHVAYVLWMLVLLKCLTPPLWSSPTGLFSWAQVCSAPPSIENRLAAAAADAATREARTKSSIERMLRPQKRSAATPSVAVRPEAAKSAVARVEPAAQVDRPEPPRRSHLSWTTIAAAVWLLGALALAGNWLWKWIACSRLLRRSGVPANEELELLAARTAERLGLRRAVAVRIVSEGVGPAVFGLWRPVIVIPQTLVLPSPFGRGAGGEGRATATTQESESCRASALTLTLSQRERGLDEQRLKQIEPILAHELIHVRRDDAYVGLLQMIAQVLWWFHPLVWWMNREMCRRREQCCDEEAIAGIGCSGATYARCLLDTLELELQCGRGRRRLLSAVPGVGSAEITMTRLEHIMDDARRFHCRTPRWTWGVLAVLLLLVLPGRAMVLGYNAESPSTKDAKSAKNGKADKGKDAADRAPTLAEIAKANEATWNAMRTIDMEYTQTSRYMNIVMGKKNWIEETAIGRWLKAGNQERLKRSSKHDYCDYYIDDVAERRLSENHRKDADYGRLSPVDVKEVDGGIYPKNSRMLARRVYFRTSPEVLRDFYLHYDDLPPTLAEIIATWKVTLKGKTLSAANDTLWLLHANYPAKFSQWAGSYIDFYVNGNKGFLVEKAFLYEKNSCSIDGKTVSRCHSIEVKEYQALGGGVFFPKRSEYRNQIGVERLEQISADKCDRATWTVTKLTVNAPLASDAFDFRFPAGVTVYEYDKILSMEEGKVYIWGADNKPAQKFASEREYSRLIGLPQALEEMRQRVEKKIASKKPDDLTERCEYYIMTRKYDKAIATSTRWFAADPKPEERVGALQYRGMTYIFKNDYDKAVVDLTEALRLVEKLDKKDDERACWARYLYCFRSLAYVSQDNTLHKAMDDLSKIDLSSAEHGHFILGYWAPLFRTAIRLRHVDFSSLGQDKAQAGREAKRSFSDILESMGQDKAETRNEMLGIYLDLQHALGAREGPEAYAMMIYFLDKMGVHEEAEKHREVAKRESCHGTAEDGIDFFIDDAFQKGFARLTPEIEKEAVVIRKARASNP